MKRNQLVFVFFSGQLYIIVIAPVETVSFPSVFIIIGKLTTLVELSVL